MQGLIPLVRISRPDTGAWVRTLVLCGPTLVATICVGVLVGWWVGPKFGLYALVAAPVIVVSTILFVRPVFGAYLLALLIPVESLVIFGGQSGVSFLEGTVGGITWIQPLGLVVFAAWAFHKLMNRGSWSRILSTNFLIPALLWMLFIFASLFWADGSMVRALRIYTSTIQLLAVSLLIIDLIDTRERLEWIVRLAVMGGFVSILLTLYLSFFSSADVIRAGDAISGDVNATAAYIVLLSPFAFYLLRTPKPLVWRAIGLLYLAMSPVAVGQTLSRTSFLMMPVVFASQIWEMTKRNFRNMLLMLTFLLVVGTVVAVAVDMDKVLERGRSITPYLQGVPGQKGEYDSARVHHWIGALLIFKDHPFWGVGYGSFGVHFFTYQLDVPDRFTGGSYYSNVRNLRDPHSTMLGMLAELGLIGTALWIWIVGITLLHTRRSWIRSKKANDRSQEVLGQALFYSLLAYVMYSVVSAIQFDKVLWLILALSVVQGKLTMVNEERSGDDEQTRAVATATATRAEREIGNASGESHRHR